MTDKKEEPKKDIKDEKPKDNKKKTITELLATEELVSAKCSHFLST